jgi:hypothetical protein
MKRKVINETQQYYNSTYKGGEKWHSNLMNLNQVTE